MSSDKTDKVYVLEDWCYDGDSSAEDERDIDDEVEDNIYRITRDGKDCPKSTEKDRRAVNLLLDYLKDDLSRGWHRSVIPKIIAENNVNPGPNRLTYICINEKEKSWGSWLTYVTGNSYSSGLFKEAVLTKEREKYLLEKLDNRFKVYKTRYLPPNTSKYFKWSLEVTRHPTTEEPTQIMVTVEW